MSCRLASAALLALLAATLPIAPGLAAAAPATDADAIIAQVRTALRERDGAEPDAGAVVGALNGRVFALHGKGDYAAAAELAKVQMDYAERVLGAEHPDTLRSVNNLAFLYDSQGRYGEAEPLYRRALEASERVLGAGHPQTIGTQLNLAWLLVNQDRIGPALRQLRALDGRMRALVAQELASTEQESVRLARLAAESRLQHVVFTLALAHPRDPQAQGLAADVLLRWKRLAADEESVVTRLARTSQDPRVVEAAGSLRGARAELGRLENLSMEKMNEAHRTALAKVRGEVGRLEVALAQLSRTFRGQQARRGVGCHRP